VLTDQPPRVLAVGAGLRAEAGRIRHKVHGQQVFVEDFVPVNVGDRNFGRRNQVVLHAFDLEQVFLELRKLARAGHAVGVDHEGRQHFGVAVLPGVQIQHEIGDSPFQLRGGAPVKREARSGDFGAAGEIQDVQIFAELEMLLGLKVQHWLFAPGADDRIVFRTAAQRHGFVLNIRHDHDEGAEFFFGQAQAFVIFLDLGGNLAHPGDER